MPKEALSSISEQFALLATRFDGFATPNIESKNVARDRATNAIRAVRLLFQAIDRHAFPESAESQNKGWWDRSIGRMPGNLFAVYQTLDPQYPCGLKRDTSDGLTNEELFISWSHTLGSWLILDFPERFRAGASELEWEEYVTNAKGEPIDRDGKTLKRVFYKDGKPYSGKIDGPGKYEARLDGEQATVYSRANESTRFTYERAHCEVYADACRLLAELIAEAVTNETSSPPVEAPETSDWVGLSDLAKITPCGLATLRNNRKKLPIPCSRARKQGGTDKWRYHIIRPEIEKLYGCNLPSEYPWGNILPRNSKKPKNTSH